MDHRKWLVMFAGIASISLAYYFVLFLPAARREDQTQRRQVQFSYELCLTNAASDYDKYVMANGGVHKDNGLEVTAPTTVFAQAAEARRDDERRCNEEYPANKR